MKKEIFIAIVIGVLLGLVVTIGVWSANQALNASESTSGGTQSEETTEQPTPTTSALSLSITNPENNSISSEEEVEITGKTISEAVVVILYEEGEKIIQADQSGQFSTEITLVGGGNEVTIKAYDDDGAEVSQILNLIYSTAEI